MARGATQQAISNCDAQGNGAYHDLLPAASPGRDGSAADGAAAAAHDGSMDILGLDVTWEAEFAQAGWIEPWTGASSPSAGRHAQARAGDRDVERPAVRRPEQHQHPAAVVRSDLVPKPPATWAEMIADAEQLAKQGKPHYIEIQGAQYEGATVWFNTW